jgi:protein-S-isoprenylcysteine O-methyltransferase Ste14
MKNLRPRFAPIYAGVALALLIHEPSPTFAGMGLSVVAMGLLLRTWGAGHLVKRDRLTVTGPYAHLRHPLYAGTLLICVGFAVALDGWLMWVLLAVNASWFFLRYFPRKERAESELLEERYGGAYARYRSQVSALVPSLIPWRPTHEIAESVSLSDNWRPEHYADNNEIGTLLAVLAGVCLLGLRAAAIV